jgi:putative DNA primase/helicase
MEFTAFARAHGLLIKDLKIGRWCRVPTEDHPKKRNGAYKFLGEYGFVQNWAVHEEPELWKPEAKADIKIDHARLAAIAQQERARIQRGRQLAAQQSLQIMEEAMPQPHPYLEKKGFPDERGMVWNDGTADLLAIPMRKAGHIVGCQLIHAPGLSFKNRDGDDIGGKKFMPGQELIGCSFVMGQGKPIYCEGYATGLSVRAAVSAIKIKRSVVVCFTAHNLTVVAQEFGPGVVVADNDAEITLASGKKTGMAGQNAAKKTGMPYWVSDRVGEDFNDFHQRVGLFCASQSLKRVLMK